MVKAEICPFKIGTIARKLFIKKLIGEVAKLPQFSPSRMYFNEINKHIIFITYAYSTYKHFFFFFLIGPISIFKIITSIFFFPVNVLF